MIFAATAFRRLASTDDSVLSLPRGEQLRFVTTTDVGPYAAVQDLVKEKYWSKLHAVNDSARQEYAALFRRLPTGELELLACVAVLEPSPQPFFSEMYLNERIETLVQDRTLAHVARSQILELGSLASRGSHGAAMRLLKFLPILLWRDRGYSHVLCTATDYVQRIMASANYEFVPLATATPASVPEADLAKWGDYYDHKPLTGFFGLMQPAVLALELLDRPFGEGR